jgi:hypothetical protein
VILVIALALGWFGVALVRGTLPAGPRPIPTGVVTVAPKAAQDDQVTWVDLDGMTLPVSSTAGPRRLDAGRASGFAHTERGAAFAAANLLARTFPFVGPAVFEPTIAQQVVGPDAAALARQTSQTYRLAAAANGVRDGMPTGTSGDWIVGYAVDRPGTPDDTTIRVLVRGDDTNGPLFGEFRVRLVWRDGDWRLVAPAWGDWRSTVTRLSSPDPSGYRSYDPPGT